jgi:hypothetical protein
MIATEAAPAFRIVPALSSRIPPIATTGFRTRPQISASFSIPSTGSGFSLLDVGKDRAGRQIVDRQFVRFFSLAQIVSRKTDNPVRPENFPGTSRRKIRLTKMYACGAGDQRNIDPIVNDHTRPCRRLPDDALNLLEQLAGRCHFVADL